MWVNLFYLIVSIGVVYLCKDTKIMKYIKFQYKFWIYYIHTVLMCTILLPGLIFRPKDPRNGKFVVRMMILIRHVIGLKWQIRNSSVLAADRGAVIIANHQSTIDILGLTYIWQVANNCIIVSKKVMMYIFTCGICMYLCGSIFIDRNNPKEAYEQLETKSKKAFKNKTKIFIFPEGTRNRDLTKLLRFKKGAFAIAVASQVPIIPVVFSPYYFINNEKQIFNKGHVIIQCLEAVPTEGLTMDDLPDLMDRIYNSMDRTYKELLLEVKSTLPPNYPIALPDSEHTD